MMTTARKRRRAIKDNPLDGEQLLLDAMFGERALPTVATVAPSINTTASSHNNTRAARRGFG